MAKTVETLAEFQVKFGKVTFGEESISIPISIERAVLGRGALSKGDSLFCGRRLNCTIKTGGATDQQALPGMKDKDFEVSALVECQKMGVSRRKIGTTLNLKLDAIDPSDVTHFANRAGTMSVTGAEDLPEKKRGRPAKSEDGDEEDEGDEE